MCTCILSRVFQLLKIVDEYKALITEGDVGEELILRGHVVFSRFMTEREDLVWDHELKEAVRKKRSANQSGRETEPVQSVWKEKNA